MSRTSVPDFFFKSPVSTTDTWGFIKETDFPHQEVTVAEYHDYDERLMSMLTANHLKLQNAIWVCDRHRWRSSSVELTIKNSSTDLESQSETNASLANYEAACKQLYHWESHNQGRLASVYAVFFIERNFAAMNLEAVNSLLLEVSTKRLTEWSMVALLRSSYSARHMLPAWKVFFREVKKAMEGNERAHRLLAGLDD